MRRNTITRNAIPKRMQLLQPKNERVPSRSSKTALVLRSASAPKSKYYSNPLLIFSQLKQSYILVSAACWSSRLSAWDCWYLRKAHPQLWRYIHSGLSFLSSFIWSHASIILWIRCKFNSLIAIYISTHPIYFPFSFLDLVSIKNA